ncbi:MAG: hypothetical protein R2795_17880 [Saprospiraceae bacterium]
MKTKQQALRLQTTIRVMKPIYNQLLKLAALLLCIVLLGGTLSAAEAGRREFSKTLNKQYNISADGTVDLTNKHGKIDVKTWAQQQVRISVKIVVKANDEDDAQDVFNRINIRFFNASDLAGAETIIDSQKSSWWNWGGNSDDYAINYEVYMPSSCQLKVDAKYCDVYAVPLEGSGNIVVKYGNIKLDGFGEDSHIVLGYGNGVIAHARDLGVDLSYGNMSITHASDVNLSVRYGNVDIENGGDVVLDSRYSNFKMGEIREFRNTGKYDNVEIAFAEEIVCETQYTDIKLARLGRRANLDMSYGAAKISMVEAGFDEIQLNGRYTDFKIYLANTASCSYDISGSYTDIALPSSGVERRYDVKNGSSHQVKGTVGSGSSQLMARLSYGGIVVGRN